MRIDRYDREKGHTNFVLNTWLMSGRTGFEFSACEKSDYYGFMEPYIKMILGLPETVCLIAIEPATNKGEEETFIGHVVAGIVENKVYIHYIYVKQAYRRFGMTKKLLEPVLESSSKVFYTTIPNQWKWSYTKNKGWKYDRMYILNRLFGENAWTQNQLESKPVKERKSPSKQKQPRLHP